MNTPKTAALWELLREMGWSEDQRPVSFIMQSHEELEKELSDLEAGFDADGRTAAEACCEDFKREQVERIKTLERQLAAETARADEQFALAMELAAKLETERATVERMKREHDAGLKGMEMIAKMLSDERALADKLAARLEREVSALQKRFEQLASAAARVEWKFGRNDDGSPKDWTEWSDLRESLGERVRQSQELDPNEADH